MGRIFIGIVKCGAWGCFDEFNRLEEAVLSAVSTQIQAIQAAIRSRASTCDLLDRKVSRRLHVSESAVALYIGMPWKQNGHPYGIVHTCSQEPIKERNMQLRMSLLYQRNSDMADNYNNSSYQKR